MSGRSTSPSHLCIAQRWEGKLSYVRKNSARGTPKLRTTHKCACVESNHGPFRCQRNALTTELHAPHNKLSPKREITQTQAAATPSRLCYRTNPFKSKLRAPSKSNFWLLVACAAVPAPIDLLRSITNLLIPQT